MTDIAPMIQATDIVKSFGQHTILRDVSVSVAPGEVVSIIGPSGAGKSTLLRCLNLLERPDSGQLRIGEHEFDFTNAASQRQLMLLRRTVGMVFQSFNLFPHLTILENLNLAQIRVVGRSKKEATERSIELLGRVGLELKAHEHPSRLSGGQQQRAAIARALAVDPGVMLFDEPTSALDPELGNEVLLVMAELAQSGMTMIVVTHEMSFATRVSDRIIVMVDGAVVEQGSPDDVMKNPTHPRVQQFLQAVTR